MFRRAEWRAFRVYSLEPCRVTKLSYSASFLGDDLEIEQSEKGRDSALSGADSWKPKVNCVTDLRTDFGDRFAGYFEG